VDFAFVPHWDAIGVDVSELDAYSKQRGEMRVYGSPDGSGIVVEDDEVHVFGDVVQVVGGRVVTNR